MKNDCLCGQTGIDCRSGRACPVRAAQREAKAGAKHAVDADLLLATGAMTGPHRRTKPVKRGPVRRFIRALWDMLVSPRAPHL